jgi:hypothetical protein
MFVGKAGSLPTLELCLTGLARKHKARLEKPVRDKRSGLFQTFANYGHIGLCNIGPWEQCYKNFHGNNLLVFIISCSVCPWQAFTS